MSHVTEYCEDPENLKLFQRERLKMRVSTEIYKTMIEQGIDREELARRLGVSAKTVDGYTDCDPDLRLSRVSDIFTALGCNITFGTEVGFFTD